MGHCDPGPNSPTIMRPHRGRHRRRVWNRKQSLRHLQTAGGQVYRVISLLLRLHL